MNERCLGWFLDQHQEQGLFPPNGYFNDELIHYDEEHDPQHNNPLLTYDWTKELKKYFNDVVWVYYFDRVVFYDENKFPYDQPVTTVGSVVPFGATYTAPATLGFPVETLAVVGIQNPPKKDIQR